MKIKIVNLTESANQNKMYFLHFERNENLWIEKSKLAINYFYISAGA